MNSISFVNIYFICLDKIIIQAIYFVNDLKRINKGTRQGNKKDGRDLQGVGSETLVQRKQLPTNERRGLNRKD